MTPVIVDGMLFGADDFVARWVDAQCGGDAVIAERIAIGLISKSGALDAGAVFHSLHPGCDVVVTAAAARPSLRLRSFMRASMLYAFDQLAVRRVTAEIALSNVAMIKLATGIGFVREGVKRKGASDGGHAGVFGLLKKDLKI